MEVCVDLATRALMNERITARHITLALNEATEPDLTRRYIRSCRPEVYEAFVGPAAACLTNSHE